MHFRKKMYEGEFKIADFGLGKIINEDSLNLTETVVGMGTYSYAAPEQFENKNFRNADERADIYALGKILYELVTLENPSHIDNNKIKHSKFAVVIKKATKVNKEERFKNIDEMINMINLCMEKKRNKDTFEKVLDGIVIGDEIGEKINILINILLSNSQNYTLYVEEFMKSWNEILFQMKEFYEEEFYKINSRKWNG